MSKRANPMAVKTALSYEVGEAAKALGKSDATIRNWIKDGLPVMSSNKPHLISGSDIRSYLRQKYQTQKIPLRDNELYCLSCRKGRQPLNIQVLATSNTASTLRLSGPCDHCGATASRIISRSKVQQFAQTFRFQKDGNS
jgi:hypothetical protein